MDGAIWTDLFTVDINVHNGWNYYTWKDVKPKYAQYRFYSPTAPGCKINEIKFRGTQAVDNNSETHSCPVELFLNEQKQTELVASVDYKGSLSPKLNAINPRFGSVVGGTSVTFSGTGFSTVLEDYTILIDKVVCAVTAASATSVTCTTGPRPGLVKSSLSIFI
jgi:hypothetical protein